MLSTRIQLCPVISSNPIRVTRSVKPCCVQGGYGGTCEELFFSIADRALKRGSNVLIFDGPGQGCALVMQKLPIRADWEHVEYVLFTGSEGAGEHCEAGAREVFFQKMFDWLDPTMAG